MPIEMPLILAVSLTLTVIIELVFALFLKKRELLLIFLVNVLTNPIAVFLAYMFDRNIFIILFIEILVVIIEGVLYSKYSQHIKRPFMFSIFANAISYFIGVIL